MSGDNFRYYPQNSVNYNQNKQWKDWMMDQVLQNNTNYDSNSTNYPNHSNNHIPPPAMRNNYYNYQNNQPNSTRPYRPPRRYNSNNQYGPPPNWNNKNLTFKRPRPVDDPLTTKPAKKKNKPLSQNVPKKKDWTLEEADEALTCEREYNKHHKNQSLIIKFPDLEVNKDIVSKFHSSIENVHFQQPSTARFCFVTLQEGADGDSVISALNKVKFGDGFLTAEYKKERGDDLTIGPEDIMPTTLFVGNLAQEITKEDMVKTFPKAKRIDIGYAKKMKYTRYAFVTFRSVKDSIEAFKNTRNTQLHSKSLIVRFRRLHGNVGMPGESKPQNPPKAKESHEEHAIQDTARAPSKSPPPSTVVSDMALPTSPISPPIVVKQEPRSSDDESETEDHIPMIKTEVKEEIENDEYEGFYETFYNKDSEEHIEDDSDRSSVLSETINFKAYYENMMQESSAK